MIGNPFTLPDDDRLRSAFDRTMAAAARLFSLSSTKWPELLLPTASAQLEDDLLIVSLNLRRCLEQEPAVGMSDVAPFFLDITGRQLSEYEDSLWTIMGRIIHHESMKPFILRDPNFFSGAAGKIPAYLICDVEVVSDRGKINVNVPGFAIAVANELGRLVKKR